MHICFLMYPWERIDPETDSTLRIIHETVQRGYTVAVTTNSNLTIRDNVAYAFCQVFKKGESKKTHNLNSFYRRATFIKAMLPLSGFDVIVMRDNPPMDATVLNFLDSTKNDTFIINDIDGLRLANNKLYTASFNEDARKFIPKTYVSKNKEYLERVFNESDMDRMILKPFNGSQGHGVIVLEKSAQHNFKSLLDFYIGRSNEKTDYVILQEYVEGAEDGDVRVLMLNGEPIGAMRRIPSSGEVRSNVHAGGKAVKHSLSRNEKDLCRHIGPKLVRDGLYFVGLDIINDKLIEVNVMSPGGISRINRLNRTRLQNPLVDFIERIVSAKELLIAQKNRFRKAIQDANSAS